MIPKSPFLIFQNLISPLLCEQIVDALNVTTPDTNKQGKYIPSIRHNKKYEQVVFERTEGLFEIIENHYNVEYRAFERPCFEWFVEGVVDDWRCGSSQFMNQKWVRTRDRDITGVIFLSDYQDNPPFDEFYEVYGGKLEFPQHEFGFNPERGTMVVFPAGPHFINKTSTVAAGELFQIRFHIATQGPFIYQPSDFPGDYRTWFKEILS